MEPNDDELSAWCKLHGTDFAGKLIPYGARVNYKPPKTREAGQLHKFGPDSIPGVFAGYHIGPGMHWSRQYKVWPLSEFVHQNLGDDASKPRKSSSQTSSNRESRDGYSVDIPMQAGVRKGKHHLRRNERERTPRW